MHRLPEEMAREYRVATAREIRFWSFGEVRQVRDPSARTWARMRRTLDDEAIFGTRHDYQCACGKFEGKEYERLICDQCGVKVATSENRRSRFGHIELVHAIAHPLVTPVTTLEAIPILPASFWETGAGASLVSAYDQIVRAKGLNDPQRVGDAVAQLFEALLPVVAMALGWNLQDAPMLARGLALIPRSEDPD